MRTGLKILLTIVALFFGGLIITISKEATGHGSSSGGGPLGVIISLALLAGITAIWKYNPDKNNSNNSDIQKKSDEDKYKLDKTY